MPEIEQVEVARTRDHEAMKGAVEGLSESDMQDLAAFYAANGVDRDAFNKAFASDAVALQVAQSETMTRRYNPAGVPEIIVNGKYRVDRMRAGGLAQMVAVVDYLVAKERQGQD